MSRDRYLEDQLRHDFIQMSAALQEISEENTKLQAALDVAKKELKFYGSHLTWDKDLFLCGSDNLREDLEETNHSRFTPGKKARQALSKIEELLK